jgi:hypothetical protein
MGSSARLPTDPSGPRASAVDREALDYLGRVIQPALRSPDHRTLAKAVRSAVGSGSMAGLGRLGERHRRELLETIESRLVRGRPAPTPRALVRLTAVIAGGPDPLETRAPTVASPAR